MTNQVSNQRVRMKRKIYLVVPPPASLKWPSIGLAQLKAILREKFAHRLEVSIKYLNFSFARYIGVESYELFSNSKNGFGYTYLEWLFRSVAFPGQPDNKEIYFKNEGLDLQRLYRKATTREEKKKILIAYNLLSRIDGLTDEIDRWILKSGLEEADLVGFSTMFNQNLPSIAIATRLKHKQPRKLIVAGGSNCESPMGEALVRNFEVLDFVFSGPSMLSFPTFVGHWIEGEHEKMKQINGVFCRDNLHNIKGGFSRSLKEKSALGSIGDEMDINQYPKLDYTDFIKAHNELQDPNKPTPGLFMETSRGCWWGEKAHCTFCGLNSVSMEFKQNESDRAIDHISGTIQTYQATVKKFAAVDNIMPENFPEEVFAKLKIPPDVALFYEVKTSLSKEQLKTIYRAGVKEIQPGIESLSNAVLKLIKKGGTASNNIRFLKDAGKIGFGILWNLLIGIPGESEDVYFSYEKNLPPLVHLYPPAEVGGISFSRYSPYFNFQSKFDLKLAPITAYRDLYPGLPESELAQLAYFFVDLKEQQPYYLLLKKWKSKIENLVEHWRYRYFGRDGGIPAALYWVESSGKMFDSRNGRMLSEDLSEQQKKLHHRLQKPMSIGKLRSSLAAYSDFEFQRELEYGLEKGWIWRDGNSSLISLAERYAAVPPFRRRVELSFY